MPVGDSNYNKEGDMISKDDYQMLRNLEEFQYLPIDRFDQLMAATHLRKASKNHVLFFKGDNRDKLFLIKSGYVKLEDTDSSGTFLYTDYVKHNTIFPYGGMFLEKTYDFSAKAITDIEYFYIPVDLYENFVATNSTQMRVLCQKLSRLLRIHEIRLRNVVTSSAQDRVVQSLAILLFDVCEDNILPFSITTVEIAALSATTRETVSHVLKSLKEKNIVELSGRKLVFLNRDYFLNYIY